jgi:hypothetical protein
VEQVAQYHVLSGFELPDLICDVVDLLMPELRAVEASIYLYMIRHSIVESGILYVRASQRSLQSGIVRPHRDDTGRLRSDRPAMDYKTVREALRNLEVVGAIRQEGEPNNDGTLYRVLLPEEIPACQRRRAERVSAPAIAASEDEADFYNIRENRLKIYERDKFLCTYCGKQLTRFTATLDHITPVSEGGDNSAENLKTACLQCNSRKTARPLGDFLIEMRPSQP